MPKVAGHHLANADVYDYKSFLVSSQRILSSDCIDKVGMRMITGPSFLLDFAFWFLQIISTYPTKDFRVRILHCCQLGDDLLQMKGDDWIYTVSTGINSCTVILQHNQSLNHIIATFLFSTFSLPHLDVHARHMRMNNVDQKHIITFGDGTLFNPLLCFMCWIMTHRTIWDNVSEISLILNWILFCWHILNHFNCPDMTSTGLGSFH